MSGLEADTIGGFNSLLEKQKDDPSEAKVTTVLFDDQYELLHDHINLNKVKKITSKDYFVRGTTALLDAIGRTIDKIKTDQLNTPDDEKAENVMFIITTDGKENASREYRFDKIKSMINEQKEKYGWDFLFIGANIDAIETAGKFGISSDYAMQYSHNSRGVEEKYAAMDRAVSYARKSMPITIDWKKETKIEKTPVKSNFKNIISILKNFTAEKLYDEK